MKYVYLFLLLILSSDSFAQVPQMALLRLLKINCNSTAAASVHPNGSIWFYILPQDSLVFKLSFADAIIGRTDTVMAGRYKIRFVNKFQHQIVEEITIHGQSLNYINICYDTIPVYAQNTLGKLRNQDSILIHFTSKGCRQDDDMKIIIIKENEKFIAQLYKVRKYYEKVKRKYIEIQKPDTLLETVVLTQDEINLFTKFENELNGVRKSDCTTRDWYKIESKYLNIEKNDGNCNWHGYLILLHFFHDDSYHYLPPPQKLKSEFKR